MSAVLLNVADVRLRSRVNGPGLRSVVWVQGCTIRCPGCFNPHTHAHRARRLIDSRNLGLELAAVPDTDGISISGGEPFEQAEACAILASAVRGRGRTVMVFTGYCYETLQASSLSSVKRFLATIDLLIAGPYIEGLRCDAALWRASTNQTVHALTDRVRDALRGAAPDEPRVELTFDGRLLASTGFPAHEDRLWLDRLIERVAG